MNATEFLVILVAAIVIVPTLILIAALVIIKSPSEFTVAITLLKEIYRDIKSLIKR